MLGPYNTSEDEQLRSLFEVDAEMDHYDFEDEIPLGSDDLNYALGRPCDIDFAAE